jgi:hypothetical protein
VAKQELRRTERREEGRIVFRNLPEASHTREQLKFCMGSEKENLMLQPKSLLKTLVVSIAVLVMSAVVFAGTSENQPAKPSHEVIKTYLRTDLSFKSVLSSEFVALASTDAAAASLRTCRCSCGFRCTTDADCGPGGRCTAGITCCASTPATGKTSALVQENSSSAHPKPETLGVNCQRE